MINEGRLLDTFLGLVRIDSPSGEEAAIAQELSARLRGLGLAVELDGMNNVVARLPGRGNPLLLAAHMDTVRPGVGVKPVVRDGVVCSDGTTVLGGDDKSGVAIILEAVECLVEGKLPHPPLEVVLTVQEEVGLLGAKGLDQSRLRAKTGISFDCGGAPGTVVVDTPTHDSVSAVVHGKAAHSGTRPEDGVNAILVAAEALVSMPLGRIDEETTANFGTIRGGTATNIVPDLVELRGEARSRQLAKLEAQTAAMVGALKDAAEHHGASVEVDVKREYDGYTLTDADPIVAALMDACRAVGVEPRLLPTGGGSDANIFNAAGIQVANLSPGMSKVHTTEECVAVSDMVTCAEIALNCIQGLTS